MCVSAAKIILHFFWTASEKIEIEFPDCVTECSIVLLVVFLEHPEVNPKVASPDDSKKSRLFIL